MSRLGLSGSIERSVGIGILAFGILAPVILNDYWISTLLTQMMFLGIAAASLIFLSAYAGMVSLGQISLYGIAGFALGNLTTNDNTKGLNLGWTPWAGVIVAIIIATAIAFLLGATASRSFGIYFLMITLTYSVIANLSFGQITSVSGFGGISGIPTPHVIGRAQAHGDRLYYVSFGVAVAVYLLLRYVARTPFGLALQGIRDDPVRMSSLGYNVGLHRTVAFGFAGFIAAIGGILFAWWNGHIDPASIDLGSTIDLLIIAVIGGLLRLEGAWLGALVFVVINNYSQRIGFIGERFHTLIGAIFLIIVLLSPGGLMGIWEQVVSQRKRFGGGRSGGEPVAEPGPAG